MFFSSFFLSDLAADFLWSGSREGNRTFSTIQPLTVRRLDMKQLRWTFVHLRLWVFELKLWMDGLSWEQVRIVAKGSKDLVAGHQEIDGD